MTRLGAYVWAFVGGIVVLSLIHRVINPSADTSPHIERQVATTKAPESKAKSSPATNNAALDASRHEFREYCIDAVRAKLQFPASFKPHYIMAGPPWQVTWPADHTTSWMWAFNFEASNAYGAVGRYKATCGQDLHGQVFANITLAD